MFNFENLRVYKDSIDLVNVVYEITKKYPKEELFGITNQFRRAAVSISLNIAEGSSRTKKDFKHFLSLARGSCFECVAIATISKAQTYISDTEFEKIYEICLILSKMISKLKTSLV
ncbi:MAG: S23 ribosomal protein [Candidatus Roizmanbacteria bacterium GW2011_GWA2_35_8]|uniref:S23 ribosomal protein n=1 Tax=Candidatus Roizmanbacteria bacterium GW2011_GWA2_35_8 TaxID=1618479 RepID=A0A0G0CUW5_9BACT|nr:MAG: S23 ribosomal protein [Candidatus Roizmanbacteria bacterium GW2011_GWA2_35_8]